LFFSQTVVIYFLTICVFIFASLRQRRRYLAGILTEQYAGDFPKPAFEYRSRSSLFGLPLVHVRIGDRFDVVRGPVKAWIAVGGSHTIGVIFASGGLAIAPISFGGIAIGLLPIGAITIGIFAYGACCLGVWAYGAAAVGWQVFCGCGIAWNAAMGGRVLAHDFAVGGIVHAAQANTQIAFQYVQNSFFFRICQVFSKHSIAMIAIWIVPVTLQARIVARARRRREQSNS
jgi:heme exporter protein D